MSRPPVLTPSRWLQTALLQHPQRSAAAAASMMINSSSSTTSSTPTSTSIIPAVISPEFMTSTPQHHAMKVLWSTLKRQQQQQVTAVANVGNHARSNAYPNYSHQQQQQHEYVPASSLSQHNLNQQQHQSDHPLWSYLKELNQLGAHTVWNNNELPTTTTLPEANKNDANADLSSSHTTQFQEQVSPDQEQKSATHSSNIASTATDEQSHHHHPAQAPFDDALKRSDTDAALAILQDLQYSATTPHTPVPLTTESLRQLFWLVSRQEPPNVFFSYHALQAFLFKAQSQRRYDSTIIHNTTFIDLKDNTSSSLNKNTTLDPYVAEYEQMIQLIPHLWAEKHGGMDKLHRIVQRMLYDIHTCMSRPHEERLLPIMVLHLLRLNRLPTLRAKCFKLYQYMEKHDFPQTRSLPYLRQLLDQAEYSKRDNLPFLRIFLRSVDLALEQYAREQQQQEQQEPPHAPLSFNKQHQSWRRYPSYIPPPHIAGRVLELQFPFTRLSQTHQLLVAMQRLQETVPTYTIRIDMATLELIGAMAAQREWHETIFVLWQLCPSLTTFHNHNDNHHQNDNDNDNDNNNNNTPFTATTALPIGLYENSLVALAPNVEHYPHLMAGFAALEQHYTPTRALIMSLSGQFRKSEEQSLAAVDSFRNMADMELRYWKQQHAATGQLLNNHPPQVQDGTNVDNHSGNVAGRPPPSASIHLFNAVLSGVAERGDFVSVEQLKDWLDDQARERSAVPNMPPILPNVDTFSFLLSAQGKTMANRLRGLKKSVDEDRINYHEYSSRKKHVIQSTMYRAERCLMEMEHLQMEPSTHVLREYVEMLCTAEDLETATNMVLDLLENSTTEEGETKSLALNSKTIYRVARANFDAGEIRIAERIAKHCSRHLVALHQRIKTALDAENQSLEDGLGEDHDSKFWKDEGNAKEE